MFLALEIDQRLGAHVVEHVPTSHPFVGAMQLVLRDRRGLDHSNAARAQIVDGKRRHTRMMVLMIVEEVVQILLLVGVDAPDRFAYRSVECGVSLGVDVVGSVFRAVVEALDN